MTLKRLLAATALSTTVAFAVASGASAATLLFIPGGNYSEMLHNDHAPNGTTVVTKSAPGGYYVDLTSGSTLNPTGFGNGFAQVDGPFTSLTIQPDATLSPDLKGFTKIGFTLNTPNKFGTTNYNLSNFSFDIGLTYLGAGSPASFHVTSLPASKKYDLWAQGSEVITSVTLSNLAGDYHVPGPGGGSNVHATNLGFDDIRQISFDAAAVPEPATWAMMLLGFAGLGAMLRRRRDARSAVQAAA